MRPSKSLWAAVLCVALVGCGEDTPSVTITEADPVAERGSVTSDTSALAMSDSTLADSVLVDSVEVAVADTVAAPPNFDPFWTTFQAAIRSGVVSAVTYQALLGEEGIGLAEIDHAYITAFTEPFKSVVLSLSPRDFERDGTAREIRVVVGYDENGRVVPEDEATTDAGIVLRFDVVNGRYRWVGFKDET